MSNDKIDQTRQVISSASETRSSTHHLYRVEYEGHLRNHVLFFLTLPDAEERIEYHVHGTILNGMVYQKRRGTKPEITFGYVPDTAILLGTVKEEEIARLEAVCEKIEPPAAQMKLNGCRIDPSKPLRRCSDWIREVTEELQKQKILQTR